jgi:predicted nucleic acid-binding protein
LSVFLVDTNVFSEARKQRPEGAVLRWLREQDPATIYMSVITIGEVAHGIKRLREGATRERLSSWLAELEAQYGPRILPVDRHVVEAWAAISASFELPTVRRMPVDLLIAATALAHGLTIVTRNVRDFDGTGVEVVNPWDL